MSLYLVPCTAEHLGQLVWISKKTFIDAFRDQNNPVDFESYIEAAFSEENLGAELNTSGSEFYLVHSENGLVGYFKLNEDSAQTDLKTAKAMELERIYVLDEFQGLRIGQWMLEQALRIARQRQKQFLWLGVWEENVGAIRFYEKNGFTKFGRHPYFIGSDRQMDWLMRADLQT